MANARHSTTLGRRALRRLGILPAQPPVPLRSSVWSRPCPLDAMGAEVLQIDGLFLRIYRAAYQGGKTRGGERFPGLPHDVNHPHHEHDDHLASVPTFVLVHGIGVSARYFTKLASDLSKIGEVFLLDLPGFARLPTPPRVLSVAGFAAAVHKTLIRHGVKNPIIVGHSMGAQVVVELLARRPDYARAGVLIGPPVNDHERSLLKVGWRFAQSSIHESRALRIIALRAYLQCGIAWFVDVLPQMMRYPIEQRIKAVRVPMVLVRGEFDFVAPTSWLHRLGAKNPHVVTGAAHSVIYAHDSAVYDIIASLVE